MENDWAARVSTTLKKRRIIGRNCDLRVWRKRHGTGTKRKKRKAKRERGSKGIGQDSSKTLDIGNVASGLDLSRRSDPVTSGIFNMMSENRL
jgi:hypothetical protein